MSALWHTWIQSNVSNFTLNQSVKTEIKKSSKSSKAPIHWKKGARLNFMMFTGHSGHSYVTSFRSSIVSSQWTPPRCSTYRCDLRLKITKEGSAPGHLSVLLSEMYHDKKKDIQATFFTHLITGWVLRRKLQERKWCLNSIAGRRRQREKKKKNHFHGDSFENVKKLL